MPLYVIAQSSKPDAKVLKDLFGSGTPIWSHAKARVYTQSTADAYSMDADLALATAHSPRSVVKEIK